MVESEGCGKAMFLSHGDIGCVVEIDGERMLVCERAGGGGVLVKQKWVFVKWGVRGCFWR